MSTTVGSSPQVIPGLFYFQDLIDGSEIFDQIDKSHYFKAGTSATAREVIQYGKPFIYQGQKKDDVPVRMEFPEYLAKLRKLAIEKCLELKLIEKSSETLFNQCIINKYEPGQKISAHVDAPSYGPLVACFSILSGITIVFKKSEETKNFYVEDGSLYVMSGESRWDWTHEIKGVKTDTTTYGVKEKRSTRISITFRSNENKT